MPKRIRDYPIYLAPSISGVLKQGMGAEVIDERTGRNLNYLDLQDKIFIYERQVSEWFLNNGALIVDKTEYGFVVLMICMSYIEGIEYYRNNSFSTNRSRESFVNSLKRIFGDDKFSQDNLNKLYKHVRCSLFHTGMSDGQLIISNHYDEAISFLEDDTILINPKLLLRELTDDFNNYLSELRDTQNTDLRRSFNSKFKLDS